MLYLGKMIEVNKTIEKILLCKLIRKMINRFKWNKIIFLKIKKKYKIKVN